MFETKKAHLEFLNTLVIKEFNKSLVEVNNLFAWENFILNTIQSQYAAEISNRLEEIINQKNTVINCSDYIRLTNEDLSFIQSLFEELLEKNNIEKRSLAHYEQSIIDFFNDYRKIDYLNLSKSEQQDLLGDEDIFQKNPSIYEKLGLSHMQYKYLYQQQSVYK